MAPRPRVEKLHFNDKLKGLPTDVLLKKLKALHTELSELDQERVDTKTLASVRKELIQPTFLVHKDKGVRAYVACCLADLLRLYAPDAPYTGNELRDIFQFFIRQLTLGLKSADTPYYTEYFYLLESLASIKSIVLVCDLPQADELMAEIFRDFFDLLRTDMAKNVEMFMSDILVALIDEAQTISDEVLEVILAQFTQKLAKIPPPSYRLAVDVCTRTSERLQRNVCQYFTDIILSSDDEQEMDRIEAAHDLIKALNRDCPALLLNVVPQLEEEVKVDRLQMRTLATQVLGEMFGEPKNGVELSRKYIGAWQAWLQRRNDKAAPVRLAFVEGTKNLIVHHAEFRAEIEGALKGKLLDPDEKVRAAVCRIYSQLDYETALHHVSSDQLKEVAGRCMDKKPNVRTEAFTCLGKLFRLAGPEIEASDPHALEQFSWIPNHIFKALTVSADVKNAAEDAIYSYILPLPTKGDDETAWTEQLLAVSKLLDERGMQALLVMSNLKSARPSIFEKYVNSCAENNGGVIDENEEAVTRTLNRTIAFLSNTFPDPSKASEDLHAFAKANEARLYKNLRVCMDTQSDLRAVIKAQSEYLRRIEQTLPNALETMTLFLRKASYWLINSSSVPTLVKKIQRDEIVSGSHQSITTVAETILRYISKFCPTMYRVHVVELTKAIGEIKNVRLVEVAMQALAAVVSLDSTLSPTDKRTVDRITKYALGENARLAKFAGRILAATGSKSELSTTLMEKLAESLPDAEDDKLVAHLAILAQFALSVPDVFELQSESVISYLVRNVMLQTSPLQMDDPDIDWLEDDKLDPLTRAKLLSIKICTNRCLSQADAVSAQEISAPVLKMLWTLVENGGSPSADSQESAAVKSRIRLQAGIALLRLSFVDLYRKIITANLPLLAVMVQDSCFHVRFRFLSKLIKYLVARKLDARFNVIPFLTAHDPEREVREKARAYVVMLSNRSPPDVRTLNFEMIFIRLLHLLAHHPDFAKDVDGIRDMSKYIEFFVEIIASKDNVPLLYHLALKAKTVRDADSDEYNENLYMISELAQHILRTRAQSQSWNLPSFPGKVKLPIDIFKAHASPEQTNQVLKRVYLPKNLVPDGIGKSWKSPTKDRDAEHEKIPRKRKESHSKAAANGRSKRRRETDDEDDLSAMDTGSDDEHPPIKRGKSSDVEDDDQPRRRSARQKALQTT